MNLSSTHALRKHSVYSRSLRAHSIAIISLSSSSTYSHSLSVWKLLRLALLRVHVDRRIADGFRLFAYLPHHILLLLIARLSFIIQLYLPCHSQPLHCPSYRQLDSPHCSLATARQFRRHRCRYRTSPRMTSELASSFAVAA
jgi:hypothetical protein